MRAWATGLPKPSAVKRTHHSESGSRPPTSTWTVWARSATAVTDPLRTTEANPASDATSHCTATGSGGRPPPLVGSGARRVQATNPVAVGSPVATPSRYGSASRRGARRGDGTGRSALRRRRAATAAAAPTISERRPNVSMRGMLAHAEPARGLCLTPRVSDRPVIEVRDLTGEAIQAAIDALPAEGGEVRLGPGTFEVRRMLRLRDGTTLVGAGPTETVLALTAGTSQHLVTNADGHDGNRDLELRSLGLLGRADEQPVPPGHERYPFSCGAFLRNVDGVVIRDVVARDVRSTAFHFERCRHVRIDDVETHGVGWSGVSTAGTDDIEIRGVLCTDSGRDRKHSAVHLDGGTGALIEATALDATGTGIMLEAWTGSLFDVVVRGEARRCDLGFSATAAEGWELRHVLVTGDFSANRVAGVRVANADRIDVVGATIRDNGECGVRLQGARGARCCVVASCTIEGNPVAVEQRDASADNLVVGNSHQAPPTATERARARAGRLLRTVRARATRAARRASRPPAG